MTNSNVQKNQARELTTFEMEKFQGGFCNSLAYWEAVGDALMGARIFSYSLDDISIHHQYIGLYHDLWDACH